MEPKVKIAKSPRVGHGFSLQEIKKAGMTVKAARKKRIRVDVRRKSTHDENVRILKGGGKPKSEKKPAKPPKKKTTKKKVASKAKKTTPPPPKK